MKFYTRTGLPLLLILALASCSTPENRQYREDFLTEREQKSALAKARPPQQFGYSVFPTKTGVAFSGSARLHPNHRAERDFLKGSFPVIKMQGRSSRNRMNVLLDTSTPTSWLEFSTAAKFGTFFLGYDNQFFPYSGVYNTGKVNAFAGVITQLRIDQLFMESVPFYVRMARNYMGPANRGIHKPHIDAVLGWDNLRLFSYVQIDLKNQKVRVSSSDPYAPSEDLLMARTRIVNLKNFGLAVEGALFGEPTPIMLDFAGDYHFARGDKKMALTRQVSLGEVVFRKVPTLLLPVHNAPPRIGQKLLLDYIITICNDEGVVYLERHPE